MQNQHTAAGVAEHSRRRNGLFYSGPLVAQVLLQRYLPSNVQTVVLIGLNTPLYHAQQNIMQ